MRPSALRDLPSRGYDRSRTAGGCLQLRFQSTSDVDGQPDLVIECRRTVPPRHRLHDEPFAVELDRPQLSRPTTPSPWSANGQFSMRWRSPTSRIPAASVYTNRPSLSPPGVRRDVRPTSRPSPCISLPRSECGPGWYTSSSGTAVAVADRPTRNAGHTHRTNESGSRSLSVGVPSSRSQNQARSDSRGSSRQKWSCAVVTTRSRSAATTLTKSKSEATTDGC